MSATALVEGTGREDIDALGPWFHNVHLPDGRQTCPEHPLGDFPSFKWRRLAAHLPEDLTGWTALDIGCNAGFYSVELARRGARVTAVDVDEHYLRQAAWVAEQCGVGRAIEVRRMDVYELASAHRTWDLVLFLGVFYHLRYPLLGLDCVSRCVGKKLVFQAMTMPGPEVPLDTADPGLDERDRLAQPGWPVMAFLEHRLAGDPTNWWAPNAACCEALLRSSGLRPVARPLDETWLCEPDPLGPSSFWTWDGGEFEAATHAGGGGRPR